MRVGAFPALPQFADWCILRRLEPMVCHSSRERRTPMNASLKLTLLASLVGAFIVDGTHESFAQNPPPPDHPAVTVRGQVYTPRSILARNMGSEVERVTQFPPHRIVGNIYYVGTKMLSSFLIATPEGHILIDST